jgi:hypothetical protein
MNFPASLKSPHASEPALSVRKINIFCTAPLDPALDDGGSALRQWFAFWERADHLNNLLPKN